MVKSRIPLLASVAALGLCAALLGLARALQPDWQRAGLLTSLWLAVVWRRKSNQGRGHVSPLGHRIAAPRSACVETPAAGVAPSIDSTI